jgi:D-alanyl-lipoteichoic acid acyltransferase DltB (MBOAT superfamily)
MLFASFDFLLFFAVVLAGYWALRELWVLRAIWVIAASYFFYMAASKPLDGPLPTPWYFAGLLLLSTCTSYAAGLGIGARRRALEAAESPRSESSQADPKGRPELRAGKGWLLLSLAMNLGLLAYFKYSGFASEVAAETATLLGLQPSFSTLKLLLPVGISFYTFQSVGYVVDVYRGQIPAERRFLRFALFLSFFPHLVAGPIVRAGDFLPQLERRPELTREDVDFALFRIAKGLVKKMLFGDFIAASFVDRVFASPAEYGSAENLLALYGFTLQIYCDFSGYSDIAIGSARLLGIRFPENFYRPYQAVDVADFWRRWHMTLSSWLRDYVYYPLGGSRLGGGRTYLNLWLTMFLVGIWHGAGWTFVLYALLQASAMVFNRFVRVESTLFKRLLRSVLAAVAAGAFAYVLAAIGLRLPDPALAGKLTAALALFIALLPSPRAWPSFGPLHVLLTLHFSVLSRIFFRADTLDVAREIARKLVAWDGFGVRNGLLGNEALSNWLSTVPFLAWARPAADWCVLAVLLIGFAIHYTPARSIEQFALRFAPRVPALVAGVGFAILIGALGLLLAGPRPNIYFAF